MPAAAVLGPSPSAALVLCCLSRAKPGYTIESDVHHDQIRAWAFSETDRVFAGADNIN